MTYALSLLDKSLIPEGASAADTLQHTIALARRAEQLGYRRFWVAEHHGEVDRAGSAPEVLVSHILAHTSRIRVGSGGVMLQHYSPYKVAESFKLLASLAPGRVDLGIGKAPGGLPQSTRALQALHDPARQPGFAQLLADLDGFLKNSLPDDHPLAGAVALPQPPHLPECVLLGGTPDSATQAAHLGWGFSYAGHFNGDPSNIERSIAAYRAANGRALSLALYAFAADSTEKARRLVQKLRIFKLHLPSGHSYNLPSHAGAVAFAQQAGARDYRIEETQPYVITGSPDQVRAELDELSERFGIQEFVIDIPVAGFADRLASVELLAAAYETVEA